MPELKGKALESFPTEDVDTSSIPYKDKTREKQRQLKLEERKNAGPPVRRKSRETKMAANSSWSKKKEKSKRKELKKKRSSINEMKNSLKRKSEMLNDDEMDELSKEARLVKKLKSGKITKAEFEQEVNDDDEDIG